VVMLREEPEFISDVSADHRGEVYRKRCDEERAQSLIAPRDNRYTNGGCRIT
jgi:hypothetical protein